MFARLAVLFVTTGLVELYLLLRINEWTGSALTTIGLILLTGVLGAALTKQQGIQTLRRAQHAMGEGRMPAEELMDGAMILVAGALLLTPGVLTDAFGFSLLFPPCRVIYRKWLKAWFPKPNIQFHHHRGPAQQSDDPSVVDGVARPHETDDAQAD